MSVKEMTKQNIWQDHFPEPCGGGRALWDKLAHTGSRNSNAL